MWKSALRVEKAERFHILNMNMKHKHYCDLTGAAALQMERNWWFIWRHVSDWLHICPLLGLSMWDLCVQSDVWPNSVSISIIPCHFTIPPVFHIHSTVIRCTGNGPVKDRSFLRIQSHLNATPSVFGVQGKGPHTLEVKMYSLTV